jgi:hypothetical protein
MKYIIKSDEKQAVSLAQGVPRSTTKVYMSIQTGNIKNKRQLVDAQTKQWVRPPTMETSN